jgi:hypothetical protein
MAVMRRSFGALIAVLCAMVLLPVGAFAAPRVAAGKPNPLADPSTNTMPSHRFLNACDDMSSTTAANRKCDGAALHDFDAVRKKEGLGPMTLPRDFASLSVPSQLLAISNIERVDRGLHPVIGRSARIDALAVKGAKADEDPPFPNPFDGNSGGANWAAAGNSALLDDFFWMYDDGLGSFNEDCTTSDRSGCWGHRHDIINPYQPRVVMGAAVAYKTRFGTSMTEEFIGGDTNDSAKVAPTWHAIAATFPLHLVISASRTRSGSGQAVTVTGKVTIAVVHTRPVGQRVELEQRSGPGARWQDVTTLRTAAHGAVHFTVHPTHSVSYRLQARSVAGARDGVSAAIRVVIA